MQVDVKLFSEKRLELFMRAGLYIRILIWYAILRELQFASSKEFAVCYWLQVGAFPSKQTPKI